MRRTQPLDATFFGLEAPGHPLHGMAVMVLDPTTVPGGYSFDRLQRFIGSRLPGIPPLRQRLVQAPFGLARPGWVDSEVDVAEHVSRHVLVGGTLADVASYAAEWAATPLDRSKPLWHMRVVEGLADGTIAVVAKVHHSLMDGVAGMDFLASMFSLRRRAGPVREVGGGSRRVPGALVVTAGALPELLTTPMRAARALVSSGLAVRRLGALARRQGGLSFPSAPRLRWNGALGASRSMALASLPLAEVKEVSHTTRCTVNDVVLSVLGGACRAYLRQRGELPDSSLVAVVPVSTHEEETRHHPTADRQSARQPAEANALSILVSTLGTDIPDPLSRLRAVHDAMVQSKRLHDALGAHTLSEWLAVASPLALTAASRAYLGLRLAGRLPMVPNILVSNVPGPPVELYFGGARLVALYPLGPVYDGVGLNVTVVSCTESLGFGLVSSPEVLDDLDALALAIGEEFRALYDTSGARPRQDARRRVTVAP